MLLWSRRPVDSRARDRTSGTKLPSLPFVMRSRCTDERALAAMDAYKSAADAWTGKETARGRFFRGFPRVRFEL